MNKYSYVARDDKGKVIRGVIVAENDLALSNKISNLGYFLTSYKIIKRSADTISTASSSGKGDKLKQKEVLQLTYQLAILLKAGLPLLEGLRNLAQDATNERMQNIVDDIRYRVESGTTLHDAFAHHNKSFPSIYRALIKAGESTGKLPETLNDLAELLEWQLDLKGKLKKLQRIR